ncbi:MAG: MerR family transcriptional regulator [Micrococcales bacterium]|nr:MerR family transcriptional regulator [Micrococcales bacterium]
MSAKLFDTDTVSGSEVVGMMKNDSPYLMGIGDFSHFARLSVRMLRHYDERGLLVPDQVDPFNGYRFYSPPQLRTASHIRTLRDSGCSIEQIAQLLGLFDNTDALKDALDEHAASLSAAAQKIADQQTLLSGLVESLGQPAMSFTVEERLIPAMQVVSLRQTIATYQDESKLWERFGELFAPPTNLAMSQFTKRFGATYFDPDYRESDVDIAIWGEFRSQATLPEPFELVDVPAQKVAWTTLFGSYANCGLATDAIGAWITEQGYTLAGPVFWLYVVSPSQDPNPDNWVTEINYPIA